MTLKTLFFICIALFSAYSIYSYVQFLNTRPIPAYTWDYQEIIDEVHHKRIHFYSLAAYNHPLDRTAEIAMSCDNNPKQPAISLPITIEPMIRYRTNDELMSQPVHARLNWNKTEIESINDAIFYQRLPSIKHLTLEVFGINGQTYQFKFDLKEYTKAISHLTVSCQRS